MTTPQNSEHQGGSGQPVSIKVFGVGGAGGNMIQQLMLGDMSGMSFCAVGTNARSLAASAASEQLLLETKNLRGMGTGSDPERGRAFAEAAFQNLKAACASSELVFIFAGLGGGTGTGVTPVIARAARENNALVLAFVTLPFECEGNWRMRQALQGMERLRAVADAVICLPNQKVFKLVDENAPVVETFQRTNDFLAESARGVQRLVTQSGIISVKFADLCAAVRGRHAESAFATVEASGAGRAKEVWEKLVTHPLLDDGQALAEAATVLVSLRAGVDLSMAEINRFMEQVNRHCESARVIMGATVDLSMGDQLSVTVVATKRGKAAPEETDAEDHANSSSEPALDPMPDLGVPLISTSPSKGRPASRFVAPPPPTTPEAVEQILNRQAAGSPKSRRKSAKMKQTQLPLEIVSKGRFDKSEPTIHNGEDLDMPTYIRRGLALN